MGLLKNNSLRKKEDEPTSGKVLRRLVEVMR
jgi:hypothetical protein